MISVQTTDIVIRPGASARFAITLAPAAGADPVPLPTQAWFTVKSTLAEPDSAASVQRTLDPPAGITAAVGPAGTVDCTIDIPPALTARLVFGGRRYFWDFLVKFSDGYVGAPEAMTGEVTLQRPVTSSS